MVGLWIILLIKPSDLPAHRLVPVRLVIITGIDISD